MVILVIYILSIKIFIYLKARLIYKIVEISNKEIVTMANTDIIIHDEKDNVGVVVIEKITPNQDCNCWIMENDKSATIQSLNEISLGHKIAMVDLKEGDTIIKYGHDIGKVVKNIKKGEHVHVHNVKTKKW